MAVRLPRPRNAPGRASRPTGRRRAGEAIPKTEEGPAPWETGTAACCSSWCSSPSSCSPPRGHAGACSASAQETLQARSSPARRSSRPAGCTRRSSRSSTTGRSGSRPLPARCPAGTAWRSPGCSRPPTRRPARTGSNPAPSPCGAFRRAPGRPAGEPRPCLPSQPPAGSAPSPRRGAARAPRRGRALRHRRPPGQRPTRPGLTRPRGGRSRPLPREKRLLPVARSARSRPVRTLLVLGAHRRALRGHRRRRPLGQGAVDPEAGAGPRGRYRDRPLPAAGRRPDVGRRHRGRRVRQHHPAARERERRLRGRGDAAGQAPTPIVVSLPGKPDHATVKLVEQSAQAAVPRGARRRADGGPAAGATPTTPTGAHRSAQRARRPRRAAARRPRPKPKRPGDRRDARRRHEHPARAAGRSDAVAAGAPSPARRRPAATAGPPAPGTTRQADDASDPNWVTRPLQAAVRRARLQQPRQVAGAARAAPPRTSPTSPAPTTAARSTCSARPSSRAPTSPGAAAGLETNSQGFTGADWQVNLTSTARAPSKFGKVTTRLFALQNQGRPQPVRDRPRRPRRSRRRGQQAAITTGPAADHRQLHPAERDRPRQPAEVRRAAGVVPSRDRPATISATLGSDQLRRGLLAGVIGLALVVLYSLLQYRALGVRHGRQPRDRRR